jgi:hypothetical protein
MMMKKTRLMVDGHVHIYDCYNLETFFKTAVQNLEYFYDLYYSNGSPFERILLLTEGKTNDFFSQFKENSSFPNDTGYHFLSTKEEVSIILAKENKRLGYLLKGRQIVTEENLEVLAIGSGQTIEDGLPIETVLERIMDKEEMAVLAWGFGKWLFRRGKIIKRLIKNYSSPYLLVGDNSGRPTSWPIPHLFKRARGLNISIINGSDPLPFAGEETKVGSYGFSVEGDFNEDEPAKSLRDILVSPGPTIGFFGQRDNTISFIKRQSKIYSKKYSKKYLKK